MKISLCNEVIAELPFEKQCNVMAKLGYDGVEIAPVTLSDEPHVLPAARRKEIAKIAKNAGIPITGLHYLMVAPQGLSITAKDPAVRQKTFEVMRGLVQLCADLGGNLMIHGSPVQRQLDAGDEADSYKRGIEYFAAAGEAARAAGVTYLLEPLAKDHTAFVNSVAEAVKIVREIGNPGLQTMIDCSAAGRSEAQSVPELIQQWMPSGTIRHIHLNDANRRGPGDGEMKFAPIVAALRAANYAGIAAVEPFIYEPDGPTCAARAIGYMRGTIEAVG
ncbi:MAG TPA: sugar phosphate isomerase/epimerase family protein [Xanthobacteraceae bacterium]|nr:sugar phosphate isomerase/epimerase family protein [Xanthobacteraceae bacterium]